MCVITTWAWRKRVACRKRRPPRAACVWPASQALLAQPGGVAAHSSVRPKRSAIRRCARILDGGLFSKEAAKLRPPGRIELRRHAVEADPYAACAGSNVTNCAEMDGFSSERGQGDQRRSSARGLLFNQAWPRHRR